MTKRRIAQAINDAYSEEMARDPKVILFGEDVEVSLFGDTRGLAERFSGQVRNTPISEAAISGMAIGAALSGYRPICHLMFGNFLYTAFDSIANQVAKMRLMTGGQAHLPVTYFAAYGAGSSTAAQHSDTPYPLLMNLGSIQVAVPSSAADAKGLMKSAIRGNRPTCFLMPRLRAGALGEVPDGDWLVPFGVANILRGGTDVTIIAIGACVQHAVKAAEQLGAMGIDAELIDPRTLVPLDVATLVASANKTGRVIIVDEARDRCSAATHIAAVLSDKAFDALLAPVWRITTPDMPVPYAPAIERAMLPDAQKIVDAAQAIMKKSQSH